MIWWDWLAQGISVLAACCTIASFQCKNSSRLLFVQGILGSSLWMIHFAMLGSWSACLMNAVGVVRALFILRQYRTGKSAPYVKWLLCTMAMLSGVFGIFVNWNGNNPLLVAAPVWLWRLVIILLPFVTVFSTLAFWSGRGSVIRVGQLALVSPVWLACDLMSGSVMGVICEVMNIISVIVSLCRFGLHGDEAAPEPITEEKTDNPENSVSKT